MIIAVTHENGCIFQHFGHSSEIKFYVCDGQSILESKVVSTNGHGHGSLVQFLKDYNTDVLICGGIGPGAQNLIKDMNIQLFAGLFGNCDEIVDTLLKGNLVQNNESTCSCNHEHGLDCSCHN